MDFQQIKYALAVENTLNLTKAAERCGVSQPALTSGVKKLEERLGGQLFHRDGRTTSVSQFGQAMLPKLLALQEQSTRTMDAAHAFHQLDQTPLRLGVLVTVGPDRVARVLSAFQASTPGVDVTLEEGALEEIQVKLDDSSIDAAILSSADLVVGNYRIEPLYHEKYAVMLPPGHPLERKSVLTLRDMDKQDYVDRLSCEMRERIWSNCEGYKVDLYARFRSQREDWIRHMVGAGIGFAFVPENSEPTDNCVVRPLVDPEIERTVNLVSLPGHRNQPSLAAFLDCIRREMRSKKVAQSIAKNENSGQRIPITKLAQAGFDARISQGYLPRPSLNYPSLTEANAYQVQDAVIALHQQAGHTANGWKIAASNVRVLEQLGIKEPFYGRMLDFNAVANGGDFAVKKFQDMVPEVEVCFRLSTDLAGPNVTPAQAASAIGSLCTAFEITIPNYKDWNFGSLDAICVNSGFAGYVLGQEIPFDPDLDLAKLRVELAVNGTVVQNGTGGNALGNPINSLATAANNLHRLGKQMKKGELYLSGSLVPKHHLTEASFVEGRIEGLGAVSLDIQAQ